MTQSRQILALDIGKVRIGVAIADTKIGIAIPIETIAMNEATFRTDILDLVTQYAVAVVVVGYPRNQQGVTTQQTAYVESMAEQLADMDVDVIFQDESLTSVAAKERLGVSHTRIARKDKIDAEAAAIILQDYLDMHR